MADVGLGWLSRALSLVIFPQAQPINKKKVT